MPSNVLAFDAIDTRRTEGLDRFIEQRVGGRKTDEWAAENYKGVIQNVILTFGLRTVMEIGGGRSPLFSQEEAENLGLDYTVNDISDAELSLAPSWTSKARFDAAGDLPAELEGKFDLIFSKMVLEHVSSGRRYYENAFRCLRKGGVALTFYPTMFCLPFVVNRIIPEAASRAILLAMDGYRSDDQRPKFPAYYSWCYSTKSCETKIKNLGFSSVRIVPFYGHSYYENLPGLKTIHRATTNLIKGWDFHPLSSYAFSFCMK